MEWLNAVVAAGVLQAIKSAQTRTCMLLTKILINRLGQEGRTIPGNTSPNEIEPGV